LSAVDAGPAVQLAVVVRSPNDGSGRPGLIARLHDQQVLLVRALLSGAQGREVGASGCDAARSFDDVADAIASAVTLASQLQRLPSELRGLDAGIGLAFGSSTSFDRVAGIAASGATGEICLGDDLALAVRDNPPDRLVVRPQGRSIAGSAEETHALVLALAAVPNNLAPALTSFVGREQEILQIRELIDRRRIVTITGVPGSGKSRLAQEVAERILGRYEDGVWLVALAPIGDPRLVMSAVADAIGIAVPAGVMPIDAVAAHVRNRQMLIVLDNLEHLVAAASDIERAFSGAPDVRIIVTSRIAPRVEGEHVFVLDALEVAAGGWSESETPAEAIELFMERAAASRPGFGIDDDEVASLVELCRRLDGLPLAIELAAARVKSLSLRSISERLDERLTLLTGGSTEQPAHHHSLGAAIGWSYDLLGPSAQRLFRRLSVFRGGWSLEGAATMADLEPRTDDATLDILASLQDAGLIVRLDAAGDVARFTMLESLRSYAADRLDAAEEREAAFRRHADGMIRLSERTESELSGPGQAVALDRLAVEHDNVRAALGYLTQSSPIDALRLVAGIWRFWQIRGHMVEATRSIDDALAAAGDDVPAVVLARALAAAGGLAYWRGDLAKAEGLYESVVAIRRTMADDAGLAEALFDLAFVFDPILSPPPEDPARTAAGIALANEAHELFVRAGNEHGIARSGWFLGSILANRDIAGATSVLESSVERFRKLGDPFGLGWALHTYGLVLLRSVDADSARAAFAEAIGLFRDAGDGSAIGLLLDDFAEVATADGDALRAARLRGAAAASRRTTHAELAIANALWQVGDAVPRGLIDPEALERAGVEGQAMSQSAAVTYALRLDSDSASEAGLRVRALGPLVVNRLGQVVSDWGGQKAGNRHAQAIFAFLMDRGDRGVTKDEFIEVLWPDAEVRQGDLNFHRTLNGLRTTLASDPVQDSDRPHESIVFTNGRYRLVPAVVSWLDVAEFQQLLLMALEASDDMSAIRGLESARALYRGDYLDDCPLYGDSAFVEERRRFLRGRLVDALVDLGRRYAARHDVNLASARFREALTASDGDCPSALDGLESLGVSPT
jgi:predicted ATPase/DNA-binding SARP family transcriptional activator